MIDSKTAFLQHGNPQGIATQTNAGIVARS